MNLRPAQLSARAWFAFALLILGPVCICSVWRASTFTQLPKASSDGPIYENIAFHLATGSGFKFDLSDPNWMEPYTHSVDPAAYNAYLQAAPLSMPSTGRPPLLSAIIAAVYQVIGRGAMGFATVRVINALCLALAGALAVANVITVLSNRGTRTIFVQLGCLGAIVLAASNRTLLSYANDFLTEPLALLLTQILVTCLLHRLQHPADQGAAHNRLGRSSTLLSIFIAITLACMLLVRSLFILWIPGIWWLLVLSNRGTWRERLVGSSAIIILTLLLMSPWWIRNCIVLQRFMPLGTQGPITLLGGYSDQALANGGDWQLEPELQLRTSLRTNPAYAALPSDTAREVMVADESRRLVRLWISNHIADLPTLFVQRIITHWNPYFGRSLLWKLLIGIGAVRLIFLLRPQATILVGLPLMNTLLVALLYTAGGRFLVPLYGVLFTLSAIGIASVLEISCGWMPKQSASRLSNRIDVQ